MFGFKKEKLFKMSEEKDEVSYYPSFEYLDADEKTVKKFFDDVASDAYKVNKDYYKFKGSSRKKISIRSTDEKARDKIKQDHEHVKDSYTFSIEPGELGAIGAMGLGIGGSFALSASMGNPIYFIGILPSIGIGYFVSEWKIKKIRKWGELCNMSVEE